MPVYRYLALGDSYTIGESVSAEERWPNQLAKHLEAEHIQTEVQIAPAERDELRADTPAAMAQLDRAAACVQRLREQCDRYAPLALRALADWRTTACRSHG